MSVIDKIAPIKEIRIKVTLQADYHFIFKIKFERGKKFEILRFFTTVLRDD